MDIRSLKVIFAALVLALLSACVSTPTQSAESVKEPPPPPQNLLGTTDELQLVTELTLDLARDYSGEKILVVLDIDNTLLAMKQDLGSVQWYDWQELMARMHPCSDMVVGDLDPAMGALFFASAMRPTQSDAASQVRRLQDAGIKVIALTARSSALRLSTFRELRRNGFSFWPGAWPPQRGFADAFTPEGLTLPVVYEDGVAFAAGQDKGVVLKALLDKSGAPYPALIVVVDDKQENLNAVMSAFSWSPSKVHAWRYTREEPAVEAFSASAANAEWKELRPELVKIQQILGPDNYDLPASDSLLACSPQ